MELRDYQAEACSLGVEKIQTGGRYLIQMPTGMGKTVCFAEIARRLLDAGKRILVIAHREELLFQAAAKIRAATGVAADVVLQSQPDPGARVWVASIQTLVRGTRREKIRPDVVIVDEAHHSAAKTYRDVLDYFNVPALGFTATPTRSRAKEKKLLAQVWSDLVYQYPLRKAILDGWLARIEYWSIASDVSLDDVEDVAGDFNQAQLGKAINIERRNRAVVDAYCDHDGGKAIAFCVDVQHTQNVAAAFRERGIRCEVVTGETPTDDRRRILAEFAASTIGDDFVIANCMVLTEGFDCPDVRMLLMARPTQSEIIYLQQLGRGLRTAPGKSACVVIDVADNCRSDKIQNCLTTVFRLDKRLQGRIVGDVLQKVEEIEREQAGAQRAAVAQIGVELTLRDILFEIPEEFGRSALAWIAPTENEYYVELDKDGRYLKIENRPLDYRLVRGQRGNTGVTEVLVSADLNEINRAATQIARDQFAESEYIWGKAKRNRWGRSKVTDAQRALLKKIAPEVNPDHLDKGEASQLISAKMASRVEEPATDKQVRYLRSLGARPEQLAGLSKSGASRLISKLQQPC